ncbi:unnamed protein product [Heligmosomoides polygyrus]|uniref:G_PROTEIN_RECEP_F1_2 domain-containing protein n=1 Tax=Heligmosomoides polygyrus TaxID=6339 RepID=A0A183FLY4_HELPZ|nr:unnamed protein product [Heligmosomoides polygyrus]
MGDGDGPITSYNLFCIRTKDRNAVELVFFFVSLAAIPLTVLTIVLILTKTPQEMRKYEWILLNLTVTSFVTDVVICFLFDPIPLFPEIACYSLTWFANSSEDSNYILFCASIILLQCTFCGTLVAFLHRLNALQPLAEKLDFILNFNICYKTAAVYLLGNVPVIVVLITSYKSRSEMKPFVISSPQLRFLERYRSYLATHNNDYRFTEFQIVWVCSALGIMLFCVLIAGFIIIHLHRKRESMSKKTLSMHRQLIFHLIIQCLTPAITAVIPMMILFATRYFRVPFGSDCKFPNTLLLFAAEGHYVSKENIALL